MPAVLTNTGQRITATVPLTVTLLSPLHHGAGVSGNTQLLRVQPAIDPTTGREYRSPMVSGPSLRHAIRHALAETTLARLGAEPGSLTKPLVDLLYSGGALTSGNSSSNESSSNIDLDTHRRLDQLWPAAGLMGYAGRGQIWAGSLYVDHLLPLCKENLWRTPDRLKDHPMAQRPVASLRDEEFGTRHDVVGTTSDRWIDKDLWTGDTTTQMIYDWQVVKSGTVWWGTLRLAGATLGHVQALRVAWEWLTASGTLHLGAKRAQGYGLAKVEADWSQLPELEPDWVGQLHEHRDTVMSLLAAAAGNK